MATASAARACAAASAQRRSSSACTATSTASASASVSTHSGSGSASRSSARPGQRVGAERAPELGEQRAERGVRGGRRALGPQDVLELVARAGAGPMADEVGEQQLALATRQRAACQPVLRADRDASAEADLPSGMPSHCDAHATGPPSFLQGPDKAASAPFAVRARRIAPASSLNALPSARERSSAGHGARRRLSARGTGGAGRDGQRLPRDRARRPPRRRQAPARREARRPLRDRGPPAVAARPPARGQGARDGRRSERPLPDDGVGRGRGPRARAAPRGHTRGWPRTRSSSSRSRRPRRCATCTSSRRSTATSSRRT